MAFDSVSFYWVSKGSVTHFAPKKNVDGSQTYAKEPCSEPSLI